MSLYRSVVLSFCDQELDEDTKFSEFPDCGPLRKLDTWLKRQGYENLLRQFGDFSLASNAILFGGCYDGLDIGAFCLCIQRQQWKRLEDVQLLFWDDGSTKFDLITFPLPRSWKD